MFHDPKTTRAVLVATALALTACSSTSNSTVPGTETRSGAATAAPVESDAPTIGGRDEDDRADADTVEPPPRTEPTTTSTTSAPTTSPPEPERVRIESTIFDPTDFELLNGRQRGLLPSGPDRVPDAIYGSPDSPDGPCAFSWSSDLIGIGDGDFLFIKACEFDQADEATAYVETAQQLNADATIQSGSRTDATVEPIADVGPFSGTVIRFPAIDDRSAFQRVRMVAQYGIRSYELIVSSRVDDAAASTNVERAAELAQHQIDFWGEIGLDPESPGTGFDDAPARYTTDDALLPFVAIAELAGEPIASWDTDYDVGFALGNTIGGGNIARNSRGSRTVSFGDGRSVSIAVERYDTAGDATRRFASLNDVFPNSAPATAVEGLAGAVREDDRSESDTVRLLRGDRIYVVEISRPGPSGDADGQLVVRLAEALDAHLDSLGLASPPAPDEPVDPTAVSFPLVDLFPVGVDLDDVGRSDLVWLRPASQFDFDGTRLFNARYAFTPGGGVSDGDVFVVNVEARHDDRTLERFEGDVPVNADTWSVQAEEGGAPAFARFFGDYAVSVYFGTDLVAASGGDGTATNPIVQMVESQMTSAGLAEVPVISQDDFVALGRPLELVDVGNLGAESFQLTNFSRFRMEEESAIPNRVRSTGGRPDELPAGAIAVWRSDVDIVPDGVGENVGGEFGASLSAIRFGTADEAVGHVEAVLGTTATEPVERVHLVEVGGITPVGEGGVFAMAVGRWAFVIDNRALSALPDAGGEGSSPLEALRTDAVGHALLIRESGLR